MLFCDFVAITQNHVTTFFFFPVESMDNNNAL